ncbi:GNAT family N-acetyltransferase [Pontibacter sp. SGAir0037]|nr:GNAT family N-acetyltransferase [Pontibacter sp. SGAir0037]
MYRLIDKDRNYLRQWLPFIDNTLSVDDTTYFLNSLNTAGHHTDLVFVILLHEELVGIIGMKGIDLLNRKLEIGYWLGEEYQGKGIIYRSCSILIKHAFNYMGINRIQIKVAVGNEKSRKIPVKLGFTLEGTERAGELIRDTFVDLQVFSLLRSEWQNLS